MIKVHHHNSEEPTFTKSGLGYKLKQLCEKINSLVIFELIYTWAGVGKLFPSKIVSPLTLVPLDSKSNT